MEKYRILVVDDEEATIASTKRLLEKNGYEVETAMTGREGLEKSKLFKNELAVVLEDYKLPDGEGTEFAAKMREINDEISIITFSCHRDENIIHKTLRSRSLDYVYKLAPNDELLRAVDLGCKEYEKNRTIKPMIPKNEMQKQMATWGIITQCEKMFEVGNRIEVFKTNDLPTLITGETGAGKELVANALHHHRRGNFVNVDCTKLTGETDLVLSELFGHEKGAFTGAIERKIGLVEKARDGTLFLDELQDLSPKCQKQILRTLQENTIRRVGGTNDYKVQFRLVAAVKPNIEDLVSQGKIVPDLYYRLRFLRIDIPSLRERIEDIEPLSLHILKKIAKDFKGPEKMINAQAIKKLEKHTWTGNVRDLQGVLTSAYALCQKSTIGPNDIQLMGLNLENNPFTGDLDTIEKESNEKRISAILEAVKRFKSIPMAAAFLGRERTSLHSLISRLGIRKQVDLLMNK